MLVEIGMGNRGEFDCSEFYVETSAFFGDEGNITEITEEIVDASYGEVFSELETYDWRSACRALLHT